MKRGTATSYRVFTRVWWKESPSWPNGLEPYPGAPEHTLARSCTEEEAREMCQEWNASHDPGRLSLKAEFEEE